MSQNQNPPSYSQSDSHQHLPVASHLNRATTTTSHNATNTTPADVAFITSSHRVMPSDFSLAPQLPVSRNEEMLMYSMQHADNVITSRPPPPTTSGQLQSQSHGPMSNLGTDFCQQQPLSQPMLDQHYDQQLSLALASVVSSSQTSMPPAISAESATNTIVVPVSAESAGMVDPSSQVNLGSMPLFHEKTHMTVQMHDAPPLDVNAPPGSDVTAISHNNNAYVSQPGDTSAVTSLPISQSMAPSSQHQQSSGVGTIMSGAPSLNQEPIMGGVLLPQNAILNAPQAPLGHVMVDRGYDQGHTIAHARQDPHQQPSIAHAEPSHASQTEVSSQSSQVPQVPSSQPVMMSQDMDHPVVPSQRSMDPSQQQQQQQQVQASIEAHQEAVAAAAQQVMAQQMAVQQMAMMQSQTMAPSQPMEHVAAMAAHHVAMHQQQHHPPQQPPQQPPTQQSIMTGMGINQPVVASQDTSHVVMSQLGSFAPQAVGNMGFANSILRATMGTPTTGGMVVDASDPGQKRNWAEAAMERGRKKSRRHTVSTLNRPSLKIQTTNLPNKHTTPLSAVVAQDMQSYFGSATTPVASESAVTPTMFADDQKVVVMRRLTRDKQRQALGNLSLPPPPTPAELGLRNAGVGKKERSAPQSAGVTAEEYEGMSREQLIARLLELEQEKLASSKQNSPASDLKPCTPSSADTAFHRKGEALERIDAATKDGEHNTSGDYPRAKDDPFSADADRDDADELDDDEEEVDELDGDQPEETHVQCLWKDCGEEFDELKKLISHLSDVHVGSGKPTYCCEWKDCARNQKPFTKRHKMYNHLRTHTGERPFVCTEEDCGKRFSRPDSLTTHIKTHSNVRPYICPAKGCGKAYYHSRSLKKHEKTHEQQLEALELEPVPAPAPPAFSPGFGVTGPVPVDYHLAQHPSQMLPLSVPNPTSNQVSAPHVAFPQQVMPLPSPADAKSFPPAPTPTPSFPPAGMVDHSVMMTRPDGVMAPVFDGSQSLGYQYDHHGAS